MTSPFDETALYVSPTLTDEQSSAIQGFLADRVQAAIDGQSSDPAERLRLIAAMRHSLHWAVDAVQDNIDQFSGVARVDGCVIRPLMTTVLAEAAAREQNLIPTPNEVMM